MAKIPIFIPTRGRAGQQLTYRTMNHDGFKKHFDIRLICPFNEIKEYSFYNEGAVVLGTPEKVTGIGPTRQLIMDWCKNTDIKHVIMCDDDHKWCIRKDPSAFNMRDASRDELTHAFLRLQATLQSGINLAGITARGGSNRYYPDTSKFHTRQNNVHAIDVKTFFDIGARFDLILTFLRAGHKNQVITDFAWDQKGSNAKGGCSSYRTEAVQAQGATGLRDLHPDFVRVVEKQTKTGWDGLKTRLDVVMSWKKAYESSRTT